MKGKTLRRLFAWLLSAMLLATCVPTAFAEEILPAHEATQSEPEKEETTPEENKTAPDGTACEHVASPVPRTDWVPVGEYMRTPEIHAVAKAAVKVTVCALCGAELNREPMGGESEPRPEAHTFVDGVCAVCGYAQPAEDDETGEPNRTGKPNESDEDDETGEGAPCRHEAAAPKMEWVATGGYRIGSDAHAAVTAEYSVTVCALCGAELYREPTGEKAVAEEEPHDFGEGNVCAVCGSAKLVPSANPQDGQGTEPSATGNGQPAADEPTPLSLPESQSVAACTHEGGLTTVSLPPVPQGEAVSNGNGSHTQKYKDHYERYCSLCGMHEEWDGEPYTRVEPCSYGEDDRCYACKDLRVCTHEMTKTNTYRDLMVSPVYKSNNDGTHTCTYAQLTQEQCVRCGKIVSEARKGPDKTETSACYFPDDGVCPDCGYQKPACNHPDPTKRRYTWYSRGTDTDTFTPNADGMTHTATVTLVKAQLCLICNRYIEGGEEEQKTYTKVVAHNFGDDGQCYQCGYKREACTHPNAYDRVEENWGGTSVVARDANGHTVEKWIYTTRYCPDCDKELGTPQMTGEKKTSVEDHSFDENGQCLVCGYVSVCAHNRTYTDYALVRDSFIKNTLHSERKGATQVDALYHRAVYDRVCYVVCLDCGMQVSEEIVETDVSTLEAHEFNQGVCMACGYETVCAHTRTEIDRELVGEYQITAKNELTHTAKYQVEETTRCTDCGALLSVTREPAQEVSVEHLWRSRGGYQVCADCGYQKADDITNCTHAHIYTTEDGVAEDFTAVAAQADGHLVTYSKAMQYTWCEDCDAYLGQKIIGTNKTVLEPHVFADGKCVVCGYVNTCRHDGGTATDAIYRLPRNVKDNGDGTHTMLADVWTYTYCTQCDEELSVEIARNQTVHGAHNMQYGECIYCFAKAQQTPSTPPQSGSTDNGGGSSGGSGGGRRTGGTTTVQPTQPLTVPQAPVAATQELVMSVNSIALQLTVSPSATIEIVGAEEIMTDAEYQRFDRLNLSEQIMVMLSVAGVTEDITSALPPSATLLTADAQTLIAEITGRIETGGAAPFQFEIGDVTVNGVPCKCVTITFEVTMDGVKMRTTRSFYFDPMLGEWVAMDALAVV